MCNFNIPQIIELNEFGGDFTLFEEAVYEVFKNDFLINRTTFEGDRLALKKYPIRNDREATYYHITHEGSDEENRTPNLRRMERIRFPKSFIENSGDNCLKVWRNKRGRWERILILNETERYLVILEDRVDFKLLWTAYYIQYGNQIRKYIKEYEAYIKRRNRLV